MNPRYYRAVDPSSDLVAVERAAGTGRRVRASESKRSESQTRPRRLRPKQLAVGAMVATVVLAVVAIASAAVIGNDDQSSSSSASGADSEAGGTPTATDEPGSSSAGADPGSDSLVGTWIFGPGAGQRTIRFEQDGTQVTGTVIEDDTENCPNLFLGRVVLVLAETSVATYEGEFSGGADFGTCEIAPIAAESQVVVDGDTAVVTYSLGGQSASVPMTRVS